MWTNMAYTRCDILGRKSITYLITFLILGVSFAVQYFLLNAQRTSELSIIRYAISIFIAVFNFLLGCSCVVS